MGLKPLAMHLFLNFNIYITAIFPNKETGGGRRRRKENRADLSSEKMNKEAANGVPNQMTDRRASATKTLQILRQPPHLNTTSHNARVNRHIGNRHRRRNSNQKP